MTKEQKENLFILIKSMSKSEKRQFKLYAGRVGGKPACKVSLSL